MRQITPEKDNPIGNPLDNVAENITNQLQQQFNSEPDAQASINAHTTFFSCIYAIFEEITKLHVKSHIFYFLQTVFPLIHLIAATFYSYLPEVWEPNTTFGQIIIGINSVLCFTSHNIDIQLSLPQVLIPFFWNICIAILFLVLMMIMRKSGTVNQILIYISAFAFQVLMFIGYLPTFAAFASTFQFLLSKDSISIIFFILYIFIICFVVIFTNMMTKLISYNTNPTIAPFATFDGYHVNNLFLFTGITIILTQMSQLFQDWFYIVAIIIHIAFFIYQMYDLFSFPFVRFFCMPLFAGFYVASFVCDIFAILTIFRIPVSQLIRFIVPFATFIVAFIIFFIIFRAKRKAILALLDPEDVQDGEKMYYLETLNVKNCRQGTLYFHIGFSALKPVILDGSLGLILARKFNNYDFWMLVANISAFIPSNKSLLNECITKLRTMYSKTTINRLKLHRLIKLEQSRALVSTNDINNQVLIMKSKTDEAVNSVKQFWYEVSMKDERASSAAINSISATITNTIAYWEEMLLFYPNEPRLAMEYSNFLIECLGKFEEGIVWKLKSGHLEKGYHAGIDPLFQAFVISMPKVWYDHMVDRLGNLSHGIAIDATTHTTTATTTAQDKLEEDLEVGMLDQIAVQMLQWPRLRMNLTRATSHYRPKGLNLFRILKYLAFLVWIVLILVTIVLYSSTFDKILVTYERMEAMIMIRQSIDVLRTLIFMNLAKRKGLLYTEERYISVLPHEAFEEPTPTFNYINFTEPFKEWSSNVLYFFITLYRTFADSGLNGQNVTRIVSAFHKETIPRYRMQTNGITTVNTSSKNAIISLLWSYESFSNMSSDAYDTFLNSSDLYETMNLHILFSFQSDDILSDFAVQAEENRNEMIDFIQLLLIIDLVVTIAVCLPFMFVPMGIISAETSRIFRALKSVSTNGAKAAAKAISLNSNQNIDFSSVQTVTSTTGAIIAMFILYALFFIISIILTGVANTVLKSKGTFVSNLIELSRFGSLRESLVTEIFTYVLMIGISIYEDNRYLPYTTTQSQIGLKNSYEAAVNLLNKYHFMFFQGYDGKEGIYTISSEIRDLHIVDKCNTDLTKGEMHPFYACLALERLISTFQLYSLDFASNSTSAPLLNSTAFVNLQHMVSSELGNTLATSYQMVHNLIYNSSRNAVTVSVVLLVIALIIVLCNLIIDFYLEQTLLKSMKTTLILLRHLPPPVVAETQALIDILLVKKNEESEEIFDPKQIIFNTTQSPIICIGDGFIIETINKAFRKAFNFSNEQLVGRKLTSLIEEPHEHEGDKSIEEQGAFRMYEKMRMMLEHDEDMRCTYPIQCICGDEEAVNTTVAVYPVHDKANHINNFVLMIEDKRESSEIEAKLEAAKRESAMLLSQLIPREVASFLAGKGDDFAFAAKCVTIVAVQAVDALEFLNESNDKLDEIYFAIENIAHSHPPFVKVKTLYDTLFFVGGLFSNNGEDTSHANIAIEMVKEVKNELVTKIPDKVGKSRFGIAVITGGPLVCFLAGEKHKSFEVIGELLDDALELLTAVPADSIILTESSKELLNEQNIEGMASGPSSLQQKTYLL
ncbi:hypothetical protein TRFO_30319 [Tritrichomonas foetus]|uniref:PAS domain-containing protein n=1 Tax=Tritrichomonas foetus TaxID=1144522 RepID=A0A1J4JVS0_9EUKA|nr:hypothetical protein TRFO_30319 [Tritrichomonas foetus]|eukprot:OHT02528.1 hypothetical protein TRFO_30319 [Tritrichomonas foetus]